MMLKKVKNKKFVFVLLWIALSLAYLLAIKKSLQLKDDEKIIIAVLLGFNGIGGILLSFYYCNKAINKLKLLKVEKLAISLAFSIVSSLFFVYPVVMIQLMRYPLKIPPDVAKTLIYFTLSVFVLLFATFVVVSLKHHLND